jgi:hypothetical protein
VFIHLTTNMECSLTQEENLNLRINVLHCEQNIYTIHMVYLILLSWFLYQLHMACTSISLNEELSITLFVKCLFAVTVCSPISSGY